MRRPAIAWFTRRNYPRHRALDPTGLPVTYDDWLARSGNSEPVGGGVRVVIDPAKFAAWCRAQGREADAAARSAFAQVVADNGRSRGWWHRRAVLR
jgi:hypothetical protein